MGVNFNWALNQEMLFSFALTGKPLERIFAFVFEDYVVALTHSTSHKERINALKDGDLWELKNMSDDTLVEGLPPGRGPKIEFSPVL